MSQVTADGAITASKKQAEFERFTAELERRNRERKIHSFYPDEGPLRRGLYPKHMEFFAAGLTHRERCIMAANRIGKTEGCGGYETTLQCTGDYPYWWPGRKFDRPIAAWAAGKTNETTRDIIQRKLLGQITGSGSSKKNVDGTGLIPAEMLGKPTWKQGVADFVDTIPVLHGPSRRWTTLGFKSYQQGSGSFEGTEQDLIWLDEEPDMSIYGECLIRTATTNGMIMLTFTPLLGLSKVVMSFLPAEATPGYDDDVVRTDLG